MVLADGNGLPTSVLIESATPHEVNLIEPLLASQTHSLFAQASAL